MSTLHTSTANRIGVRRNYKPAVAMGFYRGPAETPARQGQFTTHPVEGLGVVPVNTVRPGTRPGITVAMIQNPALASGANPGSRICPAWGCDGPEPTVSPIIFQTAGGGGSTSPAMPTTLTPVVNTTAQVAPQPVAATPTVSSQTSVTPTTTALPTATPTGVALTSGAASTAQAGTPVPVNWPTNQSYTDSTGYIWTYTVSTGWQVTGIESGSPAATAPASAVPTATAAGTTVSVDSGFDISTLTTWLQEDTIVSSIPNFFFVAGAGVLALVMMKSGKR